MLFRSAPARFVAQGFERRVVQLEERELEAAVTLKGAGLGLDEAS